MWLDQQASTTEDVSHVPHQAVQYKLRTYGTLKQYAVLLSTTECQRPAHYVTRSVSLTSCHQANKTFNKQTLRNFEFCARFWFPTDVNTNIRMF
jgi:hypothetical protein